MCVCGVMGVYACACVVYLRRAVLDLTTAPTRKQGRCTTTTTTTNITTTTTTTATAATAGASCTNVHCMLRASPKFSAEVKKI